MRPSHSSIARVLSAATLLSVAGRAESQTRQFVVRLGTDTFAIERITRMGDSVQGIVVRHTPSTSVLRYTLRLKRDGSVASYTEGIYNADGSPAPALPGGIASTGSMMTFQGDTLIRRVMRNGTPVERRDAVHGVVLPAIGGASPYYQELALQQVRARGATEVGMYTFALAQTTPNTFAVHLIGSDSAEIIFPQGFRRGYRTNANGALLHADATNTTVRQDIRPTADVTVDLNAIAAAWARDDAAGRGMGLASGRDTAVASIGAAHVAIDYGRPAKRGRAIWGKLVPFDTVWRLGANLPTVLTTDKPINIGGTQIAPGSYSLWLIPSRGQSRLLVNRQVSGWVGVPMHDATQDITSIPVRTLVGQPAREERFRIMMQNGKLLMLWDDGGFEVPISPGDTASLDPLDP